MRISTQARRRFKSQERKKKSPGNIEYYTNITHMRACAAGTNVKGDCVFVWRLFEGLHG